VTILERSCGAKIVIERGTHVIKGDSQLKGERGENWNRRGKRVGYGAFSIRNSKVGMICWVLYRRGKKERERDAMRGLY